MNRVLVPLIRFGRWARAIMAFPLARWRVVHLALAVPVVPLLLAVTVWLAFRHSFSKRKSHLLSYNLGRLIPGIAQRYAAHALESYVGGNLNQAASYYQKAIEWRPHDGNLHCSLGQVYLEQARTDEAEKEFRKALDYEYQNMRALKGLGVVLQEKDDLSGAMYLYLRYLELDPKDAFVCLNLGVVFHDLGNYEKAVQVL